MALHTRSPMAGALAFAWRGLSHGLRTISGRLAAGLTVLAVALASCEVAPYTQRRQLILMSPQTELQQGALAFQQVVSGGDVEESPRVVDPVVQVGERIAAVAERPDYRWEFVVLDDDTPNAFALPGGKVAIYTGILPVARTTSGLAVVMGHEVAHALARHGAERASQSTIAQLGAAVVGVAGAASGASRQDTELLLQVYGAGAQVGALLPWSRTQESEADHIGLILMAKAGYDPREALDFWARMRQASERSAIEFLSTHPGHDTREAQIREWLPEAVKIYDAAPKAPIATLPKVAGP